MNKKHRILISIDSCVPYPDLQTVIRDAAAHVLYCLNISDESELSIVITDDDTIAGLNRSYLHRNGPTNVISFPQQDGDFPEILPQMLGDVVISADTAKREGEQAGITFNDRILQLLIHGVLHLVGFDHETDDAAAASAMRKKEDELFSVLVKDRK